ncbi:hypothetical protein ACHAWF_002994 [Thalassiosira exigua]
MQNFGAVYDDMSADFLYLRRGDALLFEEAQKFLSLNDMLLSVRKKLRRHGKTNADFGITEPTIENRDNLTSKAEVDDGVGNYFNSNFGSLTDEQRAIFDQMTGHIDRKRSAQKQREIVIACAMSGIDTTLLRLGTTFHRKFAAPILCNPDSCSKLKLNSNEARIINEACLIVIDEVSMMDYKLLVMLDRFLKELMQCEKIMGGKLIILMHDFRQILPVVTGGNRCSIANATVVTTHANKKHASYTKASIEPIPTKRESLLEHARWLLSVGDETVPSVIPNTNIIEIPDQMVVTSKQELEAKIYPNFLENYNDPDYIFERAVISTTSDIVQQCNFEMIEKLPGDMVISRCKV